MDTSSSAWEQAQLSLSRGGLGLCSLSDPSSACYIGNGYGLEERHTRPADVLAANWMLGKPAAFDFAVSSSLNLQEMWT